MAPDSIIMRFPNGAWEYGFMDRAPEVGDTVVRQGITWVVAEVVAQGNDHHDVMLTPAVVSEGGIPNLGS